MTRAPRHRVDKAADPGVCPRALRPDGNEARPRCHPHVHRLIGVRFAWDCPTEFRRIDDHWDRQRGCPVSLKSTDNDHHEDQESILEEQGFQEVHRARHAADRRQGWPPADALGSPVGPDGSRGFAHRAPPLARPSRDDVESSTRSHRSAKAARLGHLSLPPTGGVLVPGRRPPPIDSTITPSAATPRERSGGGTVHAPTQYDYARS